MTVTCPKNDTTSTETSQRHQNLLQNWPGDRLFQKNLTALQSVNEPLANLLNERTIPDNVRLCIARDGSVTYRFERPDGTNPWLGHISVPQMVAEINLKRTPLHAGNMAMNGIGNGIDANKILQHLPGNLALFIFQPDLLELKLAFRLRDFAPCILKRQLIILYDPAFQPEAHDNITRLVESFYKQHPCFSPLQRAIYWNWLTEQENQRFAHQITLAMELLNPFISGQIQQLKKQFFEKKEQVDIQHLAQRCASQPSSIRVLNFARTNSPINSQTERDIINGVKRLGYVADWQMPDRPDQGSDYARYDRLNREMPDLLIMVDSFRGDATIEIPKKLPVITLLRNPPEHFLMQESRPAERVGPYDMVGWLHQSHRASCLEAGINDGQLLEMPLFINEDIYRQVELSAKEKAELAGEVVMISSRMNPDPEENGIKLHSYQVLWNAVIQEICRNPAEYRQNEAGKFLLRAQRCGVELKDEKLRENFIELIRNPLGDTVLRDIYCGEIAREGYPMAIWAWDKYSKKDRSNHWSTAPHAGCYKGEIGEGEPLNKLYNAGKIFIHVSTDGVPDQMLLNGMAAGAFFLVRSHPSDRSANGLSRYLDLKEDIVTFDTPRDLIRKIRYFLEHEKERQHIALNAREKILADFSSETIALRAMTAFQKMAAGALNRGDA